MELWTAVAGALFGGLAVWLAGVMSDRRQSAVSIRKGAFRCYVRLLKIAGDIGSDQHPDGRQGEFRYLGHDLDVYRDAIGCRPKGFLTHEKAWKKVIPILMNHDTSQIWEVAEELRALWNGDQKLCAGGKLPHNSSELEPRP